MVSPDRPEAGEARQAQRHSSLRSDEDDAKIDLSRSSTYAEYRRGCCKLRAQFSALDRRAWWPTDNSRARKSVLLNVTVQERTPAPREISSFLLQPTPTSITTSPTRLSCIACTLPGVHHHHRQPPLIICTAVASSYACRQSDLRVAKPASARHTHSRATISTIWQTTRAPPRLSTRKQ